MCLFTTSDTQVKSWTQLSYQENRSFTSITEQWITCVSSSQPFVVYARGEDILSSVSLLKQCSGESFVMQETPGGSTDEH